MDQERREFRNVIRTGARRAGAAGRRVSGRARCLHRRSTIPYRINKVIAAIGDGTASQDVVKRYAKELYYLGLWMTPEFALARRQRAGPLRADPGALGALRALVPELRRRDRLPARSEPRADEGRALPPARHHRRRAARVRADAGDHRLGLHAALLLPPLVRGGPGRVRLRARARRRHERLRADRLHRARRSTTASRRRTSRCTPTPRASTATRRWS